MGGGDATGVSDARDASEAGDGTNAFAPRVLFSFDFADAGTYGWTTDTNSSLTLVAEDRDPANTTPGALRLTAVFPPYNDAGASGNVSTVFLYGDSNTATNKTIAAATSLHFWLRLVSSPAPSGSVDHYQPFIQGGAASGYNGNFGYYPNTDLSDHAWHEFTLTVSGNTAGDATPYIADVWRVGLQLLAANRPIAVVPDGGLSTDAGSTDSGADGATVNEAADAVAEGAVAEAGALDAAQEEGAVDGGAATEGGTNATTPAPIVIDIDYIWVE
jgi:hypothetical protein